MKRLLIALLTATSLGLAFAPSAQAANTWGTDFSDMWWVPNESGWGANIAHQGEVVFMTLYVYGPDNRIRWYAATNMQSRATGSAFVFDGALYEFVGPYFGAASFNPADVGFRQAGTATISFSAIGRGSLIYSIDGVVVSKDVQRQTFRQNNLSGSYVGSTSSTVSGCSSGNGSRVDSGTSTVSHAPNNAISISRVLDTGGACTYTGTYAQSGRMGEISGTVDCTDGQNGTFNMVEIEAGYLGYMGRFSASLGGTCAQSGTMGWIAR